MLGWCGKWNKPCSSSVFCIGLRVMAVLNVSGIWPYAGANMIQDTVHRLSSVVQWQFTDSGHSIYPAIPARRALETSIPMRREPNKRLSRWQIFRSMGCASEGIRFHSEVAVIKGNHRPLYPNHSSTFYLILPFGFTHLSSHLSSNLSHVEPLSDSWFPFQHFVVVSARLSNSTCTPP